MITETFEYQLIKDFYRNKVAVRSQVKLINHITEGLQVLDMIGSSETAKRAFCLHPMLQNDEDLLKNHAVLKWTVAGDVMLLAMEYRSVANEYLSDKVDSGQLIRLSPLSEVNDMLIADKVQNYKDFIKYHKGMHSRSVQLDQYFNEWLTALAIDQSKFQTLCNGINNKEDEK